MNYNYTVIIPHKNTPDLLEKCINSIPDRDDVQVIIVDDNSDPAIVNFDRFPGVDRNNTIVIFDKSGKGAGNARNVALSHIDDTKWVLFSDSDDYFTDYLNAAFDLYIDDKSDIIYFKRLSVYAETGEPALRHIGANEKIDKVIATGNEDSLKYKDLAPVCKFVSYRIIKENGIKFEPIKYANDAMFFLLVACHSKSIIIDNNPIYVVTDRIGSLMKIVNKEAVVCRFNAATRVIKVERKFNVDYYHPNLFAFCYKFSKVSAFLAVFYFIKSFYYTPIKYWGKDIWDCISAFINNTRK